MLKYLAGKWHNLNIFLQMADIWSLGVTLFSLIFGKVPFHDENILALYNKIRTHDLSIPEEPDISPELKDLMRRMLVKKASERITYDKSNPERESISQLFYAFFPRLRDIKEHDWVTGYGLYPMASEVDNCRDLVEVTDKEVQDSIQTVPKLDTLILVKSMIKNHSFSNPFNAAKERFKRDGRSNSAPEAYEILNDGYNIFVYIFVVFCLRFCLRFVCSPESKARLLRKTSSCPKFFYRVFIKICFSEMACFRYFLLLEKKTCLAKAVPK